MPLKNKKGGAYREAQCDLNPDSGSDVRLNPARRRGRF